MPWEIRDTMLQRLDCVTLAANAAKGQFAELCRRFGISRVCGYKWLQRFNAAGEEGLRERSRRPGRSPRKTSAANEKLILETRARFPGNGARKLHRRLLNEGLKALPSAPTFSRVLKRNGCIDPFRSAMHRPLERFERPRPNQLWQMDFKGHFALGEGGRCHPLSVIDDHSRFMLVLQACADQTGATVQRHLSAAFRRYGLPDQILCDNSPPWGCPAAGEHTTLSFWLLRLGVQVIHGRPIHPQTQGKDERFHRTLNDELLCRHDWPDLPGTQQRFERFIEDYNHHRPHLALDLHVPASRYRLSPRSFHGETRPVQYDASELTRTVKGKGEITIENRSYYVTRSLAGFTVALRPHKRAKLFRVCYASVPLGFIDLSVPNSKPKHHYLPMLPLHPLL
ncbi:MAG: IS481 family transposase [Opitutaceae bacterium]|jgi:transposase InsO family protein|nr:IS481 family transposase [Opitutaceae bacterium]